MSIWYESKELLDQTELKNVPRESFELNLAGWHQGEPLFRRKMFKTIHCDGRMNDNLFVEIFGSDSASVQEDIIGLKNQAAETILRLQDDLHSIDARMEALEIDLNQLSPKRVALVNDITQQPSKRTQTKSWMLKAFWFLWPLVVHYLFTRSRSFRLFFSQR